MTKSEFKDRKIDLVDRIDKNAITILCDMLYYTNLHTKWHKDTIEAIKGVCPEYFNGKEPK